MNDFKLNIAMPCVEAKIYNLPFSELLLLAKDINNYILLFNKHVANAPIERGPLSDKGEVFG